MRLSSAHFSWFPLLLSAWRNIVRQLNRSRAALAAIAFGVVAMMLAAGFIDWNLRFGRDNTIQSQLGHLQLMKPGFLTHGRADPFAYLLPPLSAEDSQALQALPGFRVAAPRLLLSGLASAGETTLSFIGEGVDAQAEQQLSAALRFSAGHDLQPGQDKTVIVGEGLARNLGVQPGDTLVLMATTGRGGVNAVEARVVGLFQSISQAYDDNALRLPITLARQLLRTEGEHLRLILLQHTEDTAGAAQQLRQALPAARYEVVPWTQLADFYNKTSALFKKQVGVIRVIIALIIVLAITNTLSMAVMERMSEIGTQRALGMRARSILALFVLEGAMLGLLGAALGVLLGTLLALLISAIGVPMPASPGMAWGYEAGVLVSLESVVTAAGIAFATTLLASLYPAWRAAQLPIVDALRARQ